MTTTFEVINVSAKSSVSKVAGYITKTLEEGKQAEIRTVGAAALNQAVKSVAKSRGFMAAKGRDAIVRPGFGDTVINGEEKTMIKLFVSLT